MLYLPAQEECVHDGQQGAGSVLALGDDGGLLLLPCDPFDQVVRLGGRTRLCRRSASCGWEEQGDHSGSYSHMTSEVVIRASRASSALPSFVKRPFKYPAFPSNQRNGGD